MMDSGSSGSIQSSSGGEEEYDSRLDRTTTTFSGFLNNPPGHVIGSPMAANKPKPNPTPPPLPAATHHPHNSSSSFFDPFSNFFDPNLPTATRSHQNSLLNLDTHWPRNPIQLPAGSIPPNGPLQATECNVQPPRGLTLTTDHPTDVLPNSNNRSTASASASVRNPRKRTRASRRAPTTVLTTDTSNFRAMVQEFTGIPAPPFTPASSFPRARLDLFGGNPTSSPPYLLRPFPQKIISPFPSTTNTTTNSLLSPSSDFLLPKQNHHPLPPNISSIFNLQQPPPPLHQTPLPEDLLTGNVSVIRGSTPPNILSPSWGSGGGGGEEMSDQAALFGSMNGKYCSSGTKLNNNYSAPSPSLDFHGGENKGSQNNVNVNVTTPRTEGMLESWICSSD